MPFGIAAAVAAVAAAGIAAYGAHEQASAQKKALNYQAQVAANNATIASQKRSDALQRGEIEAHNAMRQQAQLLGHQRAALAANGQDITQGSALDVLASTKFLGQQDVNTIQSNAAREAWGYDIDKMNVNAEGQLAKWQADSISPVKAGVLAGVGSLASSASSYGLSKAGSSGSSGSYFKGDGMLKSYQNK